MPGAPTKLEILDALLRVTERQAAEGRAERARREARIATAQSVLVAVGKGENTWIRLHEFFPENQWKELGRSLETLQRRRELHRDSWGTFHHGARKGAHSPSLASSLKRPSRSELAAFVAAFAAHLAAQRGGSVDMQKRAYERYAKRLHAIRLKYPHIDFASKTSVDALFHAAKAAQRPKV